MWPFDASTCVALMLSVNSCSVCASCSISMLEHTGMCSNSFSSPFSWIMSFWRRLFNPLFCLNYFALNSFADKYTMGHRRLPLVTFLLYSACLKKFGILRYNINRLYQIIFYLHVKHGRVSKYEELSIAIFCSVRIWISFENKNWNDEHCIAHFPFKFLALLNCLTQRN